MANETLADLKRMTVDDLKSFLLENNVDSPETALKADLFGMASDFLASRDGSSAGDPAAPVDPPADPPADVPVDPPADPAPPVDAPVPPAPPDNVSVDAPPAEETTVPPVPTPPVDPVPPVVPTPPINPPTDTPVAPVEPEVIPDSTTTPDLLLILQSKGFRDAKELHEFLNVVNRDLAILETKKAEIAVLYQQLEEENIKMNEREAAVVKQAEDIRADIAKQADLYDKNAKIKEALIGAGVVGADM